MSAILLFLESVDSALEEQYEVFKVEFDNDAAENDAFIWYIAFETPPRLARLAGLSRLYK
jgi:hypothetical protein